MVKWPTLPNLPNFTLKPVSPPLVRFTVLLNLIVPKSLELVVIYLSKFLYYGLPYKLFTIIFRFSHLEAEMPFLSFEEFLNHIEDIICETIDDLLKNPEIKALVDQLNPGFQPPSRPFMRMDYGDAIKYLKDNGITKEDGSEYQWGEDIPEAPERAMTDKINRPIMLTHFPAEIKSFYMRRAPHDNRVTESVDVLMPNVGEIVGGSMRIDTVDELMKGFEREGIDPKPYYWYIDQRKYGSSPHGGYGLGVERILAWLCNRYSVRETCLYPRFTGRCAP
jgi:asparaginyl-tRNA synthetase